MWGGAACASVGRGLTLSVLGTTKKRFLEDNSCERPSLLPSTSADLKIRRSGKPCLRFISSAQATYQPKPALSDFKCSLHPRIQAILFARISGCTISGRHHVRFRTTHRNRRKSVMMTCAHGNEGERAFHNCPVSGHKARRNQSGHGETVMSSAPLTV